MAFTPIPFDPIQHNNLLQVEYLFAGPGDIRKEIDVVVDEKGFVDNRLSQGVSFFAVNDLKNFSQFGFLSQFSLFMIKRQDLLDNDLQLTPTVLYQSNTLQILHFRVLPTVSITFEAFIKLIDCPPKALLEYDLRAAHLTVEKVRNELSAFKTNSNTDLDKWETLSAQLEAEEEIETLARNALDKFNLQDHHHTGTSSWCSVLGVVETQQVSYPTLSYRDKQIQLICLALKDLCEDEFENPNDRLLSTCLWHSFDSEKKFSYYLQPGKLPDFCSSFIARVLGRLLFSLAEIKYDLDEIDELFIRDAISKLRLPIYSVLMRAHASAKKEEEFFASQSDTPSQPQQPPQQQQPPPANVQVPLPHMTDEEQEEAQTMAPKRRLVAALHRSEEAKKQNKTN